MIIMTHNRLNLNHRGSVNIGLFENISLIANIYRKKKKISITATRDLHVLIST